MLFLAWASSVTHSCPPQWWLLTSPLQAQCRPCLLCEACLTSGCRTTELGDHLSSYCWWGNWDTRQWNSLLKGLELVRVQVFTVKGTIFSCLLWLCLSLDACSLLHHLHLNMYCLVALPKSFLCLNLVLNADYMVSVLERCVNWLASVCTDVDHASWLSFLPRPECRIPWRFSIFIIGFLKTSHRPVASMPIF